MDYNNYKLTLPTDVAGNLHGKAYEIKNPLDIEAFIGMDGYDRFRCPDGGATTGGTKFARMELRDLREYDASQPASDKIVFAVTELEIGHTGIVHQFHDGRQSRVKIKTVMRPEGIEVVATIRMQGKDKSLTMLKGIQLGQRVESYIGESPKGDYPSAYIKLQINGVELQVPVDYTGTGFFKHGAYYANNQRRGKFFEVRTYQ